MFKCKLDNMQQNLFFEIQHVNFFHQNQCIKDIFDLHL